MPSHLYEPLLFATRDKGLVCAANGTATLKRLAGELHVPQETLSGRSVDTGELLAAVHRQ